MNVQSKSAKLDWKKFAVIAVVLAIAGYQWYVKNKDQQPALAGGNNVENRSSDEYKVNFPGGNSKSSASNDKFAASKSGTSSNKSSDPYLSGGRTKTSPEGLRYTMGKGGEHRTDHVLRHAKDMPSRPTHSVFNVQGDDVFRLVDEAYALIKSNSSRVKKEPTDDRGLTPYVVDMKREVGYKGGKSGKRKNYPKLYKVKLILGDDRVITAYPY